MSDAMSDAISRDHDIIITLGSKVKDFLFDAVRLQRNAKQDGDASSEQRIAAFIAAVAAAETACLKSDESGVAYTLSRMDETRMH